MRTFTEIGFSSETIKILSDKITVFEVDEEVKKMYVAINRTNYQTALLFKCAYDVLRRINYQHPLLISNLRRCRYIGEISSKLFEWVNEYSSASRFGRINLDTKISSTINSSRNFIEDIIYFVFSNFIIQEKNSGNSSDDLLKEIKDIKGEK